MASYPDFEKNPESVALKTWINSSRNAAANGSLMRTHPLGIMCIGKTLDDTFGIAAKVSRTTHIDPRCTVACCATTGLVRGLLRGEVTSEEEVDTMLDQAFSFVQSNESLRNPGHDDAAITPASSEQDSTLLDRNEYEKHCKATHYLDLQLDDSQKMGYVYKCLGSAVLALRLAMRGNISKTLLMNGKVNLFEETVTDLIMEGGDADTNGCVAGALLGAWFGYSRLPRHWLQGVQHHDWMLWKCEALSRQSGVGGQLLEELEKAADMCPDGGRGLFSDKELDDRERGLLEKILLKQKDRREAKEKEDSKRQGRGIGGLFKSMKLT